MFLSSSKNSENLNFSTVDRDSRKWVNWLKKSCISRLSIFNAMIKDYLYNHLTHWTKKKGEWIKAGKALVNWYESNQSEVCHCVSRARDLGTVNIQCQRYAMVEVSLKSWNFFRLHILIFRLRANKVPLTKSFQASPCWHQLKYFVFIK